MMHEQEVGSVHVKMVSAETRPRLFDGTRPASWISSKGYYVDSAGVIEELAGRRVAVPFFDRMDWFAIASGESQRPQTRAEMKEVIRAHSNAVFELEAFNVSGGCAKCENEPHS